MAPSTESEVVVETQGKASSGCCVSTTVCQSFQLLERRRKEARCGSIFRKPVTWMEAATRGFCQVH